MYSGYAFFRNKQRLSGELASPTDKEIRRLELILKGLRELQKYPTQEFYRVFVDGCLLKLKSEGGWEGYEKRQPGCLAAAYRGFAYALEHIDDEDFTAHLIAKIHKKISTQENGKLIGGTFGAKIPGELRRSNVCFVIRKERATVEGITELLDIIENDIYFPCSVEFLSMNHLQSTSTYTINLVRQDFLEKKREGDHSPLSNREMAVLIYDKLSTIDEVEAADSNKLLKARKFEYTAPPSSYIAYGQQELLDSYNKVLKGAANNNIKRIIEAKYTKLLELLHPFHDGNGRVFVNILLNMALIRQGEQIAVYEEPNIFDAFSNLEIAQQIRFAQQNTLDICGGKQLFGFDTYSMSLEAQAEHAVKVQPVFAALNRAIKKIEGNIHNLKAKLPIIEDKILNKDVEVNTHATTSSVCQMLRYADKWRGIFPKTQPRNKNKKALFEFLRDFPPALEVIKDNVTLIELLGHDNLLKLACQSCASAKLILSQPKLTALLLPASSRQKHGKILNELALSSKESAFYILGNLSYRDKLFTTTDLLASSRALQKIIAKHHIDEWIAHSSSLMNILFPNSLEFYADNIATLLEGEWPILESVLNRTHIKNQLFPRDKDYIDANRALLELMLKRLRWDVKAIFNNNEAMRIFLPPQRGSENKQALLRIAKYQFSFASAIAECQACQPYLDSKIQHEIVNHYSHEQTSETLNNLFANMSPVRNIPRKTR